jgi:hypothetical protein
MHVHDRCADVALLPSCSSVLRCSYCSYLAEEGELGESMILPARFIGEAEAPLFYFYDDGIKFKKE